MKIFGGYRSRSNEFMCRLQDGGDGRCTRNGIVTVSVKTGDKKTVQLRIEDAQQSGGDEF